MEIDTKQHRVIIYLNTGITIRNLSYSNVLLYASIAKCHSNERKSFDCHQFDATNIYSVFSDGNSEPIVHSHLIFVHVYFDLQDSIIPTLICCLKDLKRAE